MKESGPIKMTKNIVISAAKQYDSDSFFLVHFSNNFPILLSFYSTKIHFLIELERELIFS